MAICKAERDTSPELEHGGSLISDFPVSRTVWIKFLLSLPVYDILLCNTNWLKHGSGLTTFCGKGNVGQMLPSRFSSCGQCRLYHPPPTSKILQVVIKPYSVYSGSPLNSSLKESSTGGRAGMVAMLQSSTSIQPTSYQPPFLEAPLHKKPSLTVFLESYYLDLEMRMPHHFPWGPNSPRR